MMIYVDKMHTLCTNLMILCTGITFLLCDDKIGIIGARSYHFLLEILLKLKLFVSLIPSQRKTPLLEDNRKVYYFVSYY